ncbi:MAG: cysteine desulfurase [Clostridiales bacterium]|nr:cysteine desulfurase [Clostridiales bacterium]
MQVIYFDNSATTRVSSEAAAAAFAAMRENYGNPSSLHGKGLEALRLLNLARQTIARVLNAAENEVIFTSGGSEANNMALLGIAQKNRRRAGRVLLTAAEHPSLLEPAKYVAQTGFDVCYIPVDTQGMVDIEQLGNLLTEQTIFVGLHHVNNETGAVQPLTEIGALIRQKAPQAFFHIDGVQGLGKLPLSLKSWQADSCALSGHKIHAPKGIGALWLKQGCRLPPLIKGGGQEGDLRSGTENMSGIAAFAVAAKKAESSREKTAAMVLAIKKTLAEELLGIESSALNGPSLAQAAPHILNISFVGAKSEVLLHYLEQQGVCVSAGSACSAKKTAASHVLQAMNLPRERLDSAIRFSFCGYNTVDEAKKAAVAIRQALTEIRALSKAKK